MISKPLEDIKAPEKDKVTFECEVSKTNAEVKWFKVRNQSPKNIPPYKINLQLRSLSVCL